jgi:hypothetical protein
VAEAVGVVEVPRRIDGSLAARVGIRDVALYSSRVVAAEESCG